MEPNSQGFIQSFQNPNPEDILNQPQNDFVKQLRSQLEHQDLAETVQRFKAHGNDINYMLDDGRYDEMAMKHYAHKIFPKIKVNKMTTTQLLNLLDQHLQDTFDIPKMEVNK